MKAILGVLILLSAPIRAIGLVYTIADPSGDWGFPSPYGMYPRGPGYIRMSLIFDTLVWKKGGKLAPALAKSWRYLPGENAFLFKLRDGVIWHDGKRFTADDVLFTFDYVKKHPWPWIDPRIIGRVEKVDELTVKVGLTKLYAPFLANVAGTLPILPSHIWEGVEDPERFRGKKALVGTGPYRLIDYKPALGAYLYDAFDKYYLGKPEVRRIKFVKVSTEMAPVALERGDVNAAPVPPEMVEKLRREGFEIEEAPASWVAKLMINHRKKPFSIKEFRHALAYAIDRERLVRIAMRKHAVPGSQGLIPPSNRSWFNPNVRKYEHDPLKARKIIEKLGLKGLKLQLLFSPDFERIAELIKGDLEEIGIKVELRSVEHRTLDAILSEWRFDLAITGHGGLCGDPEILNKAITGESFISARYFENRELIQLLDEQLQEMNPERRREIVFRIQEIYAYELPSITLYYPKWYWAHDGKVDLHHAEGGVASGIPIPLNKWIFLKFKVRE